MTPDVIVIGAGCAGLAAATALVADGARVLVLEGRPTLGGRASAVRDAATGEKLDNGQHVLMGCYDATLAFLQRITLRPCPPARADWQSQWWAAIGGSRGCSCRRCPRRCTCWRACSPGTRCRGARIVEIMRVGSAITGRPASAAAGSQPEPRHGARMAAGPARRQGWLASSGNRWRWPRSIRRSTKPRRRPSSKCSRACSARRRNERRWSSPRCRSMSCMRSRRASGSKRAARKCGRRRWRPSACAAIASSAWTCAAK